MTRVMSMLGGMLLGGIVSADVASAQKKPRVPLPEPMVDPESGKGRLPNEVAREDSAKRALTPVLPTPTADLGSSTGRLPGDAMLTPGPPHVPLP